MSKETLLYAGQMLQLIGAPVMLAFGVLEVMRPEPSASVAAFDFAVSLLVSLLFIASLVWEKDILKTIEASDVSRPSG